MASKNQQCDRCLHKDVCRYIETIEEIKKQYPFVSSVTCNHSIRRSASSMAGIEPNTDDDQADDKERTQETGNAEKGSKKTNGTQAKQEEAGDDKEVMTMMDLDVGKIGLPDNRIVKALKGAGINTVRDIYEYQSSHDWSSVKNLTKDMLKKLSDLLTALSQSPLNI